MNEDRQNDERPFVAFYRRHKISPVAQDITDLGKHFERRSALYRHLGLVPLLLRDKSIIEFGPGSGHNAVFTVNLSPKRYVLVDGNPTGLAHASQLLAEYVPASTNLEIVESLIESYEANQVFDIVLCEAAIPRQSHPQDLLKHVAKFVAPGGVLVITCEDNVSVLSEMLRRLIGAMLIEPDSSITEKLDRLRPIFAAQLRYLKAMSRSVDDWILDNILQPLTGQLLSIDEAIAAIGDQFDVHGSSPQFLTDWTWYKSIHGDATHYNNMASQQYRTNIHNFLDYRYTFATRPREENDELIACCDATTDLVRRFESTLDVSVLPEVIESLRELSASVRRFSLDTATSIDEFSEGLKAWLETRSLPEMPLFGPFFGRGQQYLSLIRSRTG
jgi:SAM-dependent methyltransferase